MKKILLTNVIPGILLLLVGTFIGQFTQQRNSKLEKKDRYMDYSYTINQEVINISNKELSKDLKVLYKDQEIDNLTSIEIKVFNYSDLEFNKLDASIILSHDSADKLNILNIKYVDTEGFVENINYTGLETIENKTKLNFQFENLYNQNIKSSYNQDPIFTISIMLLGQEDIKISISPKNTQLKARILRFSNYFGNTFFDTTLGIIVIVLLVILGYALFIFVYAKMVQKYTSLKRKTRNKTKISELKKMIEKVENGDQDKTNIAKILFMIDEYYFNKMPLIIRKLIGVKPDIEDYIFDDLNEKDTSEQ